jgi:hypothetical protein
VSASSASKVAGRVLDNDAYRALSTDFARGLVKEEDSADLKNAIRNYSDHTDRILNPLLRSSGGTVSEKIHTYEDPDSDHAARREQRLPEGVSVGQIKAADDIRTLDRAIGLSVLKEDTKVFRILEDPAGKILGDLRPGDTWTDHAYVSTTANRDVLSHFYQGSAQDAVEVHIDMPKGSKAAPIEMFSSFGSEREMLLPRGSSFSVKQIIPAQGNTPKQIHLQLLPATKRAS